MRLSLKQKILNESSNGVRGYANELAIITGYKDSSSFNKMLRKDNAEFDNFCKLLDLVNHIWEKEEAISNMVEHSYDIDANKKQARQMLEYLAMNRKFKAFNDLIERMGNCSNDESKEFAKIYAFQYKYENSFTENDYDALLYEIREIKTNISELNIFSSLIKNYCYSQKTNYNMTKTLTEEIEIEVESLEDSYIKRMYKIRLGEIMSYNCLHLENNVESAREYAEIILSSCIGNAYKAYANFIKGYSFIFSSYEKSVQYLTESMELYKELNRNHDVEDLEEKIEFVKILWDKFNGSDATYVQNKLFLSVKKGTDISNELNEEVVDPAFHSYLKGLNDKNNNKFLVSIIKYIKVGNHFLANLPKIELIKNGYDEEIIKELIELRLI